MASGRSSPAEVAADKSSLVAAKSMYEHRGHFAENLTLQVKYHGGTSKQRLTGCPHPDDITGDNLIFFVHCCITIS